MRTTLTIDDDIVATLKQTAYATGETFKQIVNQTLRLGLEARKAPPKSKKYRLRPASLGGVRAGIDLDKALRLADALEDEGIARKLELRK